MRRNLRNHRENHGVDRTRKKNQEEAEKAHTRTAMASTAKRDQQFSSTKTKDEVHMPLYDRHDQQTPKMDTYCSLSSSGRHDTAEQGKAKRIQRYSRNTQQNQQTARLGANDYSEKSEPLPRDPSPYRDSRKKCQDEDGGPNGYQRDLNANELANSAATRSDRDTCRNFDFGQTRMETVADEAALVKTPQHHMYERVKILNAAGLAADGCVNEWHRAHKGLGLSPSEKSAMYRQASVKVVQRKDVLNAWNLWKRAHKG